MKIFLIKCPKCRNPPQQTSIYKGRNPYGNRKQCVFCNRFFIVKQENVIGRVK